MKGFDIIEGERCSLADDSEAIFGEIVHNDSGNKMIGAVADNFDKILSLAGDLVSIQKMKVQSEIMISEMRAAKEQLLAEAEVYVRKKDVDTRSVVARMDLIREMMKDFYEHSPQGLTSEDFRKIITEIIDKIGKIENG